MLLLPMVRYAKTVNLIYNRCARCNLLPHVGVPLMVNDVDADIDIAITIR